jgi:predicted DNA-binding transcriptional regulator YafY
MSKTSITIEMLRLLATQKVFKVSDFAELLETNPRNIIEYKKELEKAGFHIESIPGRYGGYKLSTKPLMPTLRLQTNHKVALDEGLNYLLKRNDFIYKDDYLKAMGVIYSALESDTSYDAIEVINRFPLSMSSSEIEKRYHFFNGCIKDKFVAEVIYRSQKNNEKTHRLHPYKLFMYNNAWFLIAWNESIHDIGIFKLNRIKDFQKSTYTFDISMTYDEKQFIDAFGMKTSDEHRIILHISTPYQNIIEDRIYGKDQTLKKINDHTTELSVTMRHLNQIKAFILGFGNACKVIEPDYIKYEIQEEIKKMNNLYNNM